MVAQMSDHAKRSAAQAIGTSPMRSHAMLTRRKLFKLRDGARERRGLRGYEEEQRVLGQTCAHADGILVVEDILP